MIAGIARRWFAVAALFFLCAGVSWAQAPLKYKAGDPVEVYDGRKWHLGTVLEVQAPKYKVHFDADTTGKHDRWVMPSFVQDRGTTPGLQPAAPPTPAAAAPTSGAKGKYAVGDEVESLYYGQWLPATIDKVTGCCDYVVKWKKDGKTYNANESRIRVPVVHNTSGENFKKGEAVYVWYSNAWLETEIKDIKDNKMLIRNGGYGDQWLDFDDVRIKNEKRERAIKAAADLEAAFFAECRKYSAAVGFFASEYDPKLDRQFMGSSKSISEALKDLAELDRIYKAKYATLVNTEKVWTTRLDKMPTFWGDIAARRTELASKMAARPFQEGVAKYRALAAQLGDEYTKVANVGDDLGTGIYSTGTLDNILDGDGSVYLKWQADLLKGAFDGAREAGVYDDKLVDSLVADTKKGFQDIRAKFPAAIQTTVRAWKVPLKDAQAEAFGIGQIKRDYPGTTILKSGGVGDWAIERTNLGVIKGRSRSIKVFYKTGKGRCMLAWYWYWQDHAGGSSYSGGRFRDGSYSASYQRCN